MNEFCSIFLKKESSQLKVTKKKLKNKINEVQLPKPQAKNKVSFNHFNNFLMIYYTNNLFGIHLDCD